MLVQNRLFRKHATGSFSDLCFAIIRDPAMLEYLDNDENRRASPNENLAREMMELRPREGHDYTEKDIKEGPAHRLHLRGRRVRLPAPAARRRTEDHPRKERRLRRRRLPADHPRAAGRQRVHLLEALSLLRQRRAQRNGVPGRTRSRSS
ncbi:MAG: DUF1800 family protein [Phycisphaerales bacterium]